MSMSDNAHAGISGIGETGSVDASPARERADLIESLDRHRFLLRHTVRDLTDEQAAERTTASRLSLAGLIKHVAATEQTWAAFIVQGPSAMPSWTDPDAQARYEDGFRMLPGENLAGLLEEYQAVARQTDELVRSMTDLDAEQPLPPAPWFAPNARWSARRLDRGQPELFRSEHTSSVSVMIASPANARLSRLRRAAAALPAPQASRTTIGTYPRSAE
jgi:Protein of unknown function (DUF664)